MNNVALRSSYFPLSPSRPTERNKVGPGEQAPKEEGGRSPIPPSLLFLSFRMLIIPISPSPQPGNGGMPTPPSPPPPPPPTPASEIHQGREESFATHLSLSGETEGGGYESIMAWRQDGTGRPQFHASRATLSHSCTHSLPASALGTYCEIYIL